MMPEDEKRADDAKRGLSGFETLPPARAVSPEIVKEARAEAAAPAGVSCRGVARSAPRPNRLGLTDVSQADPASGVQEPRRCPNGWRAVDGEWLRSFLWGS
jgi:hypothetical protein